MKRNVLFALCLLLAGWTVAQTAAVDLNFDPAAGLITDGSQFKVNSYQDGFGPEGLIDPGTAYGNGGVIFHTSWANPVPADETNFIQVHLNEAQSSIVFTMIGSAWSSTYDTPDAMDIFVTNTPDVATSWQKVITLDDMIPAEFHAYAPAAYASPIINFGGAYSDIRFDVKSTVNMRDNRNGNFFVSLARFQVYKPMVTPKEWSFDPYAGLITNGSQLSANSWQDGFGPAGLIDPGTAYGNGGVIFHTSWSNPVAAGEKNWIQVHLNQPQTNFFFSMIGSGWGSTYDTPDNVDIYATNTPDDASSWKLIKNLPDLIPEAMHPVIPALYTSPVIEMGAAYSDVRFVVNATTNMRDNRNGNFYVSLARFQMYKAVKENDGPGVVVDSPLTGDFILPGGVYYLYNPKAKAFMTGGNSWGTRAVFRGDGYPVTIEETDGGYNLKLVTNQWLGDNLYVDVTPGGVFEIEEVGKYVYTIKHGDGYLGVTDNDEVNNVAEVNDGCYWQFVTKPRFIAELKDATADNPIDATPLIGCSNFNREDHSFETAWNRLHVGGNGGAVGGDNTNFCYEVWNSSTDGFEFNQTITNLPAGTYKLTAQAFYRQGSPAEDVAAVEGGYVIDVPVTLYANDAKKVILAERTQLGAIDEGTSTALGKYADSMTQASHYFSAGCYVNTVCVEIGENEPLTIGMVKEGGVAYDWFICDNFQLTYYGKGISAAELQDEADKVIAADGLTKAIAALSTKLASAKNALQLASGGDVDGLVAAIANAEKAIADGEKALKEGTSKEMNAAAAAADAAGKAIDEAKANVEFVPIVESPWAGDAVFSGAIAAFYNPATGNFLNQGNAWGTQASRAGEELRFTITENEEGLYKIVTNNYPDRVFGWDASSGFYVDITTQAVSYFKFEPVETADPAQKVYTIWVEATKADGSATLNGYLCTSPGENTVVDVKSTMDEYCFWQFLDRTAKQSLEDAIKGAFNGAYTSLPLQTTDPSAPGYLWTNAQEPSEGPIANLLDGNTGTFFHTIWSGDSEPPHYLAVDLGEGKSMSELIFSYTRRMNNNNNRPTEMRIEGSNDNENYTEICTLTAEKDGLPTVAGNDSYTSDIIKADKAYRYFRFVVLATNNGATSGSQDAVFFTFSEFSLLQLSDKFDLIKMATDQAQSVLDDVWSLNTDYTAAEARLRAILGEPLNGTFYLYNKESGMFLSRGAAWGTEACLAEFGLPFVISTNAESITKLSSLDWTDKVISYIDGTDGGSYVDGDGRDSNFSYEAVATGGIIFKNAAAQYLGIEDNGNTKALYGIGSHASKENALVFELLTPTEYETIIDDRWMDATAAAIKACNIDPNGEAYLVDCTDKVQSASLVNGYGGWNWAAGLYRGGNLTSNENGLECYQGTGVLSQTVEGLKPGLYMVSVNAFYRINGQRVGNVDWVNNGYYMSTAYLEANGCMDRIMPVGEEATVVGTTIYPNWMSEASECFDNMMYMSYVFTTVGEDGKLTISINQPTWNNECWIMMKNVAVLRLSNEPEAINGEEGTTGISNNAAEAVSSIVFNANGAAVEAPAKGINLIKTVLSDGTTKTEKIFVK